VRGAHEFIAERALVVSRARRHSDAMNDTLTRVTPLLRRLFAAADAADAAALAPYAALDEAERAAIMRSMQVDYRAFYGKMANAYLPVSEAMGRLLYVLARTKKARCIVEFGTSFGLSTIFLAAALHDNLDADAFGAARGRGRVITTELEPSKVARARANLVEAGLGDLVDVREGDALDTLRERIDGPIDLVLLDGAKPLYVPVLRLLEPALAPGALVVADNFKMAPELNDHLAGGYVTVPWSELDCVLALRAG